MSTHGLKQDADRMERDFWRLTKAVVLVLVGFALGIYVANRQEENLREIAAEPIQVASPIAEASVDEERDRRYVAEHRLQETNEALAACRVERAILEAVQDVRFPRLVVAADPSRNTKRPGH